MTHTHEKILIHPKTGKFVCWCQYPFCTEISKLKKNERDVVLIRIYEAIKKDKRRTDGNRTIPLESFVAIE